MESYASVNLTSPPQKYFIRIAASIISSAENPTLINRYSTTLTMRPHHCIKLATRNRAELIFAANARNARVCARGLLAVTGQADTLTVTDAHTRTRTRSTVSL